MRDTQFGVMGSQPGLTRTSRSIALPSDNATFDPLYDEGRPKGGLRVLLYGGGKGTRTPGLNAASVALSQLSYTPTANGHGL